MEIVLFLTATLLLVALLAVFLSWLAVRECELPPPRKH